MERQQFFGWVTLPVERAIKPTADLGLAFRVVLLGELAEVGHEFESLVGTQDLRSPFHPGHTH